MTLAREGGDANELEIQVGVSQVLILVAFMFSFVLAMTAAFLGAPAIAADLESGVAHAMLARPIRRADLVVGRWIGLVAIVVGLCGGVGAARDRRGRARHGLHAAGAVARGRRTCRPRRSCC